MSSASPSPPLSDGRLTRQIDRGTPGDGALSAERRTPEQKELSKRKSQYYDDAFARREPLTSPRELVTKEAMVEANIRTNVIVHDEFTFITDLSYALSTRYQRPENSILVTLAHSACLLFSGNFDPAYTMTITALPSLLQPVTNKRNASLIGKAMEEGLGVPPERGLIKFVAIPDENYATGGKTVAGEIEELERETPSLYNHQNRSVSRAGSTNKGKKRQSMKSLRNFSIGGLLPTHEEQTTEQMTPPPSDLESPSQLTLPSESNSKGRKADKSQKMGRRKSFMHSLFPSLHK